MVSSIVTAEGIAASKVAAKDEQMNEFERKIIRAFPPVESRVEHRFTPGLYSRTIFMAAGNLYTTKIHKTEHQFIISKGSVIIYTKEEGWQRLEAPFMGITKPGTRRIVYCPEDCIFSTFHPTQKTTVEEVEKEVIEPHETSPAELYAELYKELKNNETLSAATAE